MESALVGDLQTSDRDTLHTQGNHLTHSYRFQYLVNCTKLIVCISPFSPGFGNSHSDPDGFWAIAKSPPFPLLALQVD